MTIETPDKPSIEHLFEGEDPEAAERRARHLREKPKQNDVCDEVVRSGAGWMLTGYRLSKHCLSRFTEGRA